MPDANAELSRRKLERVERVLDAQRAYIKRVPDPDNRYRAETNLLTLLEMRDALIHDSRLEEGSAGQG